jgi:hypothetical protein
MWYVYGIVHGLVPNRGSELAGVGSPSRPVQLMTIEDYTVVVSALDGADFTLTPEDAVRHSRVLEQLMPWGTVIPIRFGTTVPDAEALRTLILGNRDALAALVPKLRGRMEVGLKVYWRPEVLREAVGQHVDLKTPRGEDAYAFSIQVGQIAEQIVNGWAESIDQMVMRTLRPMADDMRVGKRISIYMVYNASFLIANQLQEEFRRQVQTLADGPGQGFSFHYVDGLPPFNFGDLHLGMSSASGGPLPDE